MAAHAVAEATTDSMQVFCNQASKYPLLTREEDPAHAANLLREAVEMFATWGARPYQARTEIELGKLLVEQGDTQTGSALVAQGRAVLEELGAVGWLRELDLAQVQA